MRFRIDIGVTVALALLLPHCSNLHIQTEPTQRSTKKPEEPKKKDREEDEPAPVNPIATRPKGIPNAGATCGFNSDIQILNVLPDIDTWVSEPYDLGPAASEKKKSLRTIFAALRNPASTDSERLQAANDVRNQFGCPNRASSADSINRFLQFLKIDMHPPMRAEGKTNGLLFMKSKEEDSQHYYFKRLNVEPFPFILLNVDEENQVVGRMTGRIRKESDGSIQILSLSQLNSEKIVQKEFLDGIEVFTNSTFSTPKPLTVDPEYTHKLEIRSGMTSTGISRIHFGSWFLIPRMGVLAPDTFLSELDPHQDKIKDNHLHNLLALKQVYLKCPTGKKVSYSLKAFILYVPGHWISVIKQAEAWYLVNDNQVTEYQTLEALGQAIRSWPAAVSDHLIMVKD